MARGRFNLSNIDILIDGEKVGGAEGLAYNITSPSEEAYEAGTNEPMELIDGKKAYGGTLNRAWIDAVIVKSLIPYGEKKPYFNMQGVSRTGKVVKIENAKLEGFDVGEITNESYAKQAMAFKALKIDHKD